MELQRSEGAECDFWGFLLKDTREAGGPGGIRTHGFQIRNLALYPAELRDQFVASLPCYRLAIPIFAFFILLIPNLHQTVLRPQPWH